MASHHHPCHQHPTATYCHCYSPYSACHHPPPPPAPDCHLLFHPPLQPHHYSAPAQTHPPNLHQYLPHFQERSFPEERETQHTVSSLLRRIAALESVLRGRSATTSSHSLRDAAARTIQTHFRAFLLRRSRTLRHLKNLASIKSTLNILKSSVSGKTHFDYGVMYHEVVDLLLKLDTIQGGDPMIRDGKRSIRTELNKFLDFIDGLCVERRGFSRGVALRQMNNNVIGVANIERKLGNVKCRDLKTANVEKLRGLVERIDKLTEELDEEEREVIKSPDLFTKKNVFSAKKSGSSMKQLCGLQPRVKKSVSFLDNGKVYRVLRGNLEPVIDENDDESIEDSVEVEGDLCREVEEIRVASKEHGDDDEVEAHSENGGSSNGEKDSRPYPRSEERKTYDHDEDDDFTFSAPLPLKMETRGDLINEMKKPAK